MADALLVETLALAVPLRIHELTQMHPQRRTEVAHRWAQQGADRVASQGDKLQFRDKAPRRRHTEACVRQGTQQSCDCLVGTAEVFNPMAKGLAALAFCPGGVHFGGVHWCAASHPAGERSERPWELGCADVDGFDGARPQNASPSRAERAVETVAVAGGVL